MLARFYLMRFICDAKLDIVLIFIFLTCISIWKRLVISFSSCCWRILKFNPFCIHAQTIFSSKSKVLSNWLLEFVAMIFFSFPSFLWFFRWSYGCSFHHWSSVWPSIIQFLLWSLHWCVVANVFFSFPISISSSLIWNLVGVPSTLTHLILFLVAYFFQILCLCITLIHRFRYEKHHFLLKIAM